MNKTAGRVRTYKRGSPTYIKRITEQDCYGRTDGIPM